MKVRNLYIGNISKLKNVRIETEYDETIEDPKLRIRLAKRYLCVNTNVLRTSIFHKIRNSSKMKDLIYGGKYPICYNERNATEGFEYVSKYESIATCFQQKSISQKKLLKMYKEDTINYNSKKSGGNNE